jgi:dihydroorotate dehydrogenase (NAD+) catalytic subunit
MAAARLSVDLGPIGLRSPLIAASGTVGSVWEWADVAELSVYGAAVAKSVSGEPWEGRPAPRLGPAGIGMLNGIGIQNPGIDVWIEEVVPRMEPLDVPVWGSAVGATPGEYAKVAAAMAAAGIPVVEINLSCPNLEDGRMFSMEAGLARDVVTEVFGAVSIPVGAKLSPNTEDIVGVAAACLEAGATFLTLTNTALGFGIDLETRRPVLSGGVGGYSGPGLKPISMRCVYEVKQAIPEAHVIGCGGVTTGRDVIEYVMAGASAVGVGTLHLAEPKAGTRLLKEITKEMRRLGVSALGELEGAVEPW